MRIFIFITLFFLFPNNNLFTQTWLPLEIGNKWQYLVKKNTGNISVPNMTTTYELKEIYIERDTMINSLQYFINGLQYIRYSDSDNKAYVLSGNQESVYMDFNKAAGDTFYNSTSVYTVTGGTIILFADTLEFKGFRKVDIVYPHWTNITIKTSFVPAIGWCNFYNSQSFSYYFSNKTDELIMGILYDDIGNVTYLSDHYKPGITVDPITTISSRLFNINFYVGHFYNKYPVGVSGGLIFIDSIKIESFYSRNDSIILKPLVNIPINTTSNYSFSTFLDTSLLKDEFVFNYRIIAKDKGIIPETSYSPNTGYYRCVWDFGTSVADDDKFIIEFSLSQNYPNPFNPTTSIKYRVGSSEYVTLKVYDVLGREVAILVNEEKQPGVYEVEFNASQLSSGIYFYTLNAGDFKQTKKLILLK